MKHKITEEDLGLLEIDRNIAASIENNPNQSKFLNINGSVDIQNLSIHDIQYVVDYTYYEGDKTGVWYFKDRQKAIDKYNSL